MSNSKLVKFHGNCYCYNNDDELYIPEVDGFINQALYQDAFSWFAYQLQINVRFVPLFKHGTKPTNQLTILKVMKERYGVDVGLDVFLKSYRTYFKTPRDLRALAIALLRTGRNANLSPEILYDIKIFLDSIVPEAGHCSLMAKYVLETNLEEKVLILDSSLRCARKNAIESLLYLDLAKTPEELAAILSLVQEDIEFFINKMSTEQILTNISLYIWFIDRMLYMQNLDKKFKYARQLHTAAKRLTYRPMFSETMREYVRKVFNWDDDVLYVLNLHCNYFLSKKHKLSSTIKPEEIIGTLANVYVLSRTRHTSYGLDEVALECLKEVNIQCGYSTDAYKEFIKILTPSYLMDVEGTYAQLHENFGTAFVCSVLRTGFISSQLDEPLESMDEKEKQSFRLYKLEKSFAEGTCDNKLQMNPEKCIEYLKSESLSENETLKLLKGSLLEINEIVDLMLECDTFKKNVNYALKKCVYDVFLQKILEYAMMNFDYQVRRDNLQWYRIDYNQLYTTAQNLNIYSMFLPHVSFISEEVREQVLDEILLFAISSELRNIDCVLYQYYLQLGCIQEDSDAILERLCNELGCNMISLVKLAAVIKSPEDYELWLQENNCNEQENCIEKEWELGEILDALDDFPDYDFDPDTAQSFVNSINKIDLQELGDYVITLVTVVEYLIEEYNVSIDNEELLAFMEDDL